MDIALHAHAYTEVATAHHRTSVFVSLWYSSEFYIGASMDIVPSVRLTTHWAVLFFAISIACRTVLVVQSPDR